MRRKKVCKTDLDEKTLRELETRSNLNAFIITEGKISRMAIGQKRGARARLVGGVNFLLVSGRRVKNGT